MNIIKKLFLIYVDDHKKINRYIITSIIAYLLTIFLIYFFLLFFSESKSIIISQIIKIIFIFILSKYYTFQSYKFDRKQFIYYFLFVIIFKIIEAIMMYLFTFTNVSIEINVLIVLGISSVLKYFAFKNIFK
jgi:hypothetical protein